MRVCFLALAVCIAPIYCYAETSILKETVVAKLATVGCYYHDVLWDRTGYDKDGRPKADFIALDTCTGIAEGQEMELFENQLYAPNGLKIVRIQDKLYFVRGRDLEKAKTKPEPRSADERVKAKKEMAAKQ